MRSVFITTAIIALSSNVPALASPVGASERDRNCHVNPKSGDICATTHRICGEGATGSPCTGVSILKAPVSTMISTVSSTTTALVSSTTDPTSASQTTVSRSIRRHKNEPRALRLPSTHPPAPIPATPTFAFKATSLTTSEASTSSSTAALSSFPDA